MNQDDFLKKHAEDSFKKQEKFLKEHPGLVGKIIYDVKIPEGLYYGHHIHETQLDKQKVREIIDKNKRLISGNYDDTTEPNGFAGYFLEINKLLEELGL